MRTKLVNRYICDHCGKGSCSASHMSRHESSCTMNPKRKCGMCGYGGEQQKPISDLAAAFLRDIEATEFGVDTEDSRVKPEHLEAAAEMCPACMLAAIRQSGIDCSAVEFDFKQQQKAYWEHVNDAAFTE